MFSSCGKVTQLVFSCPKHEVELCVYPNFEDYCTKLNFHIIHNPSDVRTGAQMQSDFACDMGNNRVSCILMLEKKIMLFK